MAFRFNTKIIGNKASQAEADSFVASLKVPAEKIMITPTKNGRFLIREKLH